MTGLVERLLQSAQDSEDWCKANPDSVAAWMLVEIALLREAAGALGGDGQSDPIALSLRRRLQRMIADYGNAYQVNTKPKADTLETFRLLEDVLVLAPSSGRGSQADWRSFCGTGEELA